MWLYKTNVSYPQDYADITASLLTFSTVFLFLSVVSSLLPEKLAFNFTKVYSQCERNCGNYLWVHCILVCSNRKGADINFLSKCQWCHRPWCHHFRLLHNLQKSDWSCSQSKSLKNDLLQHVLKIGDSLQEPVYCPFFPTLFKSKSQVWLLRNVVYYITRRI